MRKNTDEKSLEKINKNSIFYKIKLFFKNLFPKKKNVESSIERNTNDYNLDIEKKKIFIKNIKNIENEEITILKLQTKYRKGEIGEKDLTEEQINELCDLYDRQIAELKKSIEIKKQKILDYKIKHN